MKTFRTRQKTLYSQGYGAGYEQAMTDVIARQVENMTARIDALLEEQEARKTVLSVVDSEVVVVEGIAA